MAVARVDRDHDDDPPRYTCKPRTGKFRAINGLPSVDLDRLIEWAQDVTCRIVIVGAGVDVSTNVRVYAENPITAKEAMKLFRDAVDAAGFVVQDKGDKLVIKLGPGSRTGSRSVTSCTRSARGAFTGASGSRTVTSC